MLNAVEPGTVVAIHRRVAKDESFVILLGKVRVTTHNDEGAVIDDVVLRCESGNYGGAHEEECVAYGGGVGVGGESLSVRGRLGSMRWKGFCRV